MRIVSLQVKTIQQRLLGENEKTFLFDSDFILIFSKENSVGKTTLLRMLMYALGYTIPNTRGVSFSDYVTVLTIIGAKDKQFILTRKGDFINIENDKLQNDYSLPVDQNTIHARLFGITNSEVLDNLLGTFYVDQEKGWTLLNRGKVIGNIHFSIESLIRGLSKRTDDELSNRLSSVKCEIKKYKYMLDVAKYKAEINQLGETHYINSPADDIDIDLQIAYCERKQLEEELNRIKRVIRKNTNFEKYITSFKLRVKTQDGIEIPVNKSTLVGYGDTADLLIAKQDIISHQIVTIDRKIQKLRTQQDHEITLLNVKSDLEEFDSKIARIDVDAVTTKKIIYNLEKERKKLEDKVVASVKKDNPLVPELHDLISGYASQLGLNETYISSENDYIFTNDLKSLSGAILHKIVFAFKISYVKLIQKHTDLILPIILDSPSGREVSSKNIDEMMSILSKDFADHQIIIASIDNKYHLKNKRTIEIEGKLLPF
jgi:hypothetical protein